LNSQPKGHRIGLSIARRLVADYMWLAGRIARVDVGRNVAFGEVMALRRQLRDAPSWTAIFVKAFAIVAAEMPQLRRVYLKYPWPHLYEYASSTVSVLQEREFEGDIGILPLRFYTPDTIPLDRLSAMIRATVEAPVGTVSFHRKLIAIARLPLVLRRMIWALAMNVPRLHREIGTYGVSSAARWQAVLGTTRSPLPCLLSYGPADAQGSVAVRLNFDHRIFDGALAGRALSRLDEVINGTIAAELRAMIAKQKETTEASPGPGRTHPDVA
jgi:hypothetical protein